MLKVVNAMGDACPIPVVKTKNAIKELSGAGMVETLVDNEIAVQNLTKMAQQKNYGVRSEKLGENQYRVIMTIGESADEAGVEADEEVRTEETCIPDGRKVKKVVVISSSLRNGSNSEMLAKEFIRGASIKHNVEYISLKDINFKFCLGCLNLTIAVISNLCKSS